MPIANSYTDILSGKFISPAFPQYESISLSANITLSWPQQYQNTSQLVAVTMVITPTVGGLTVTMPDAREGSTGFRFTIKNPSAHNFNLLTNTNALINTIAAGTIWEFWLDDNSTQAGVWTSTQYVGGNPAIASLDFTSASNNLVVGGIPGLPLTTAGTLTLNVARDLLRLSSFAAGQGFAVRQDENNWFMRIIQGTANQINVVNPNGLAGNPTISLSPDISGLNSLSVGNISIASVATTPNTIASTNPNGNVVVTPNGTGSFQVNADEAQLLDGCTLKFFRPGGGNYISFTYPNVAVTQALVWPSTAPLTGQVLGYSGFGLLSWLNAGTSSAVTTINAIARYASIGGALKDSPTVLLDDAGNLNKLTSAIIGNLGICTIDPQTITTNLADEDLIVAPNGNGSFCSKGDIKIQPSGLAAKRKLMLYRGQGDFACAIQANDATAADVTWTLPAADAAGVFRSDGAGNVSISPVYSGGASTPNALARFSDVNGTIKNSTVILNDTGDITGANSATIGNITIGGTGTANRIVTTGADQDFDIRPNGNGMFSVLGEIQIKPSGVTQRGLRLFNTAGSYSRIISDPLTAADITWTLPAATSAGLIKSSVAGVLSINSLGASAGILRTDGAGNVTVNTIASTANSVAKFSDNLGTLTDATNVFIDVNSNVSIGDTTIGTSAQGTITLNSNGIPASGIAANHLSIGARTTGPAIVMALYGAGTPVTTTTSGTMNPTHKIAIFVNGNPYFLVASTTST